MLLFLAFALSAANAAGQKIEIFANQVNGLEKKLVINGTFGKSTNTSTIPVINRSQQTLRVFARPHVDDDALYFMDKDGKTSLDYSLELKPGMSGVLSVFGFLNKGQARSCSGYLALAVTALKKDGSKGETRTLKLPVNLNFKAPGSIIAQKPASRIENNRTNEGAGKPKEKMKSGKPQRYDVVMYQGLPMRRNLSELPLRIYSDDNNTGDTAAQYAAVVERVVAIWNKVGRESPLNLDFFKIVLKASQADIRLDWTGRHLLPGAQGTAYPSDGLVGMRPLARYQGLGRAGETLLQELCHMLGVAHSEVSDDIMFHRARAYTYSLDKLGVTVRDKQMLIWLYSQQKYVPIGQ